MSLAQFKAQYDCLTVAQRFSTKVWQQGPVWKFLYNGCTDGSSTCIYPSTNSWYCYSKGIGGDAISLAEFITYGTVKTNLSPTVAKLRDLYPECFEGNGNGHREELASINAPQDAMDMMVEFAQVRLNESTLQRDLLIARGVTADTLERFRVGYMNEDMASVLLQRLDDRFTPALIDECGFTSGAGHDRRLLMAGRFLFPVMLGGVVRTVIGYNPRSEKKYLKLRNSSRFPYSNMPWGLDTIHDPAQYDSVLLVEGVFDALSAIEAGFPAVATLGTYMTKAGYSALCSAAVGRSVKIIGDYDAQSKAGWAATMRHVKALLALNARAYVVRLDPSMFKPAQAHASNGIVLKDTMSLVTMADLYGMTVTKFGAVCLDNGLVVEGKQLVRAPYSVSLLKSRGVFPIKPIAVNGMLCEYSASLPAGDITKLDLNDIWLATSKDPKALRVVSESAVCALTALLGEEVPRAGRSNHEYLQAIASKLFSLPQNPAAIEQSLMELGMATCDIKTVLKMVRGGNPLNAFAGSLLEAVDVIDGDEHGLLVYTETSGIWQRKSEGFFLNLLRTMIIPQEQTVANVWHDLSQEIRARVWREQTGLNVPNSRYIVLANGVYDTVNWSFSPEFSPSLNARTCLPLEYREGAKTVLFDRFLRELFLRPDEEGDLLAEARADNKAAYIKELIGLLMIPDTSLRAFWTFLGDGRNGKSTLLSLISSLLGTNNVAALSLRQLEDRFTPELLVDKLLNVASENENARPSARVTELLKQVVGQDRITVERKYERPYLALIPARFIIAANRPIRWGDSSKAMEDRQRNAMLDFPCRFVTDTMHAHDNERPADAFIVQKLMREASGIFNAAMNGLRDLRERGALRELSSDNLLLNELVESEPVPTFFRETLRPQGANDEPAAPLRVKDLYEEFQVWWRERFTTTPPSESHEFSTGLKRFIDTYAKDAKIVRSGEVGNPKTVTGVWVKRQLRRKND